MSGIAIKELLEAGVHFGHQTKRWNPKMKPYIFGQRNGIYIIDLGKTAKLFRSAEEFVQSIGADGGTVLFVGTKRQAQDAVAEEAQRCEHQSEVGRTGFAEALHVFSGQHEGADVVLPTSFGSGDGGYGH